MILILMEDIYTDTESICAVMVTVIGNRHSDPSSNLVRGFLYFT